MVFTLVLLAFAGLAHAQLGTGVADGTKIDIHITKTIPTERCDMSSPILLALELISSHLEKLTVLDLERTYNSYKARRITPSSPSEFSSQETKEIGERVKQDWCDYKQPHCHGDSCFTPNCDAEHKKMFLTFHMCAKNLKAYDIAKIHGFSGVGLEQFLNVTLVIARKYFWSSHIPRGVFGTELWKLFERLVPTKYREAVKGTDFPLSKGTDLHNIKNKKAAATCLLIARGVDVHTGLSEYERDGYSGISDELVEKVFVSLLTGSIADRVLNDGTVRFLGTKTYRSQKLAIWKSLGMKLKSIHDLPLCMDPLTAVINEMKVTCQLKNIAFESSNLGGLGAIVQNIAQLLSGTPSVSVSGSGGKAGDGGGTVKTTTAPAPATTTSSPRTLMSVVTTTTKRPVTTTQMSKQTQTKEPIITAGYSNKSNEPAPSKGFTYSAAPGQTPRNGAAPSSHFHYQPAPAYIRS